MGTESSDEELVERFRRQGDADAFDALVRRHREPVFRLAVSVLGPSCQSEAEEVAQETFLRVHRSLPAFRREAAFRSWLYRITFNLALNVKARARHRLPHLSYQSLAEAHAPDSDPLDAVESAERALEECLPRLPEVYQAALRLHYGMGHTTAEIATLLGVPVGTVKSYLYRARHLLRALLEEKGYPDA